MCLLNEVSNKPVECSGCIENSVEQYTGPLARIYQKPCCEGIKSHAHCPDNKQYMLVILSGHETPSTEFFNTTEIHCSPFLTEEYTHSCTCTFWRHVVSINFVSNLVFVMDIRNMTYAFNIKSGVHLAWLFQQLFIQKLHSQYPIPLFHSTDARQPNSLDF